MKMNSNFKVKGFADTHFLVECQECGQLLFDDGHEKEMTKHWSTHLGPSFDDILDDLEREQKQEKSA